MYLKLIIIGMVAHWHVLASTLIGWMHLNILAHRKGHTF